ncbi:hypothetical protein BJ741DRAFT_603968 [Chytriomyces cf. hyalinus JEL632]|nr:hypothetical protein BJ741DRAFT_603968 [Chytriomyces cf. hyalinus JEL632]
MINSWSSESGNHMQKGSGPSGTDERRLVQNRLAQRAYRERKDKRIKELEEQVISLEAELVSAQAQADNHPETPPLISNGMSSTHLQRVPSPLMHFGNFQLQPDYQLIQTKQCNSCEQEKFNAARMVAQVTFLQSKLAALMAENDSLKSVVSTQQEQLNSLTQFTDPLLFQDAMMMMPFDLNPGPSNASSPWDGIQSQMLPTGRAISLDTQFKHQHHHTSNLDDMMFKSSFNFGSAQWNQVIASATTQRIPQPLNPPGGSLESQCGKLNVEWARHALKELSSLKNSPDVDTMIDTFTMGARSSNPVAIQWCLFQCSRLRLKILDMCEEFDRMKAMEIMSITQMRNQNYVDRMFSLSIEAAASQSQRESSSGSPGYDYSSEQTPSSQATPPANQSAAEMKRNPPQYSIFRQAIQHVPSLKDHQHLVDEMLELFTLQAQTSNVNERKIFFFRMVRARSKMESLCQNSDDRTKVTEDQRQKLMLALEYARSTYKGLVEELHTTVEQALSSQ